MKFIYSLLLLYLAFNCWSCEPGAVTAQEGARVPHSRTLLWADEFDGNALDNTVWNLALGDGCPSLCGWGNNEKQTYTDQNHSVTDGLLTIELRKKGTGYTSTRINSKGKKEFTYGRIETRAQLPHGMGLWPAFWMLGSNIDEVGWPKCGEIDILEYVGREPGQVFTSLHTPASHGNTVNTRKTRFADIETGFHRYAIEWSQSKITFFVDDKMVYTFAPEKQDTATWPFDQPFYLLFNLAIGGTFGGNEIDESVLPQSFIVDYVRVYALE